MANFKTHLNIAASTSIAITTSLYCFDLISVQVCVWLSFLGAVGGLAPDIDSDHSTSIRVIFTLIAVATSLAVAWQLYSHVSLLLLVINVVAVFIAIRIAIKSLFMAYSVHRGCCHSIAFALLIGMSTVCIMSNFKISGNLCWLSGLFITGGCLIHLLLDEIYSVDIYGLRIKSSFGSALKLISFKNPYLSTLQIAVIGVLFYYAPRFHLIEFYHYLHLHPKFSL